MTLLSCDHVTARVVYFHICIDYGYLLQAVISVRSTDPIVAQLDNTDDINVLKSRDTWIFLYLNFSKN